MPSGIYLRTTFNRSLFLKGNTPHNKGILSKEVVKKIELYHRKLPINCKIHGDHDSWRIHSKNNVQCNLCFKESQKNRRIKNPLKSIYNWAKQHCKKKHEKLGITLCDIEKQMIAQQNKCCYTGIEFNEENLPSLDRIDSLKGYEKENIQLTLIKINRMKSNLTETEFLHLCELVAGKSKGKK